MRVKVLGSSRGRPFQVKGSIHSGYFYSASRVPFIQATSIAPLLVHHYSEALPTQHGYCVRVSRWSATGNCEWRTCL